MTTCMCGSITLNMLERRCLEKWLVHLDDRIGSLYWIYVLFGLLCFTAKLTTQRNQMSQRTTPQLQR